VPLYFHGGTLGLRERYLLKSQKKVQVLHFKFLLPVVLRHRRKGSNSSRSSRQAGIMSLNASGLFESRI
jgi:hypothetical protein